MQCYALNLLASFHVLIYIYYVTFLLYLITGVPKLVCPKSVCPYWNPPVSTPGMAPLGIIFCQNRKMIAPFNSMQELPSLFKANGKMNIELSQDLK